MTQKTYDDGTYSDLHKDARGYRPGESAWAWWRGLSDEGQQGQWDSLVQELNENEELEKERVALAIAGFEAHIEAIIANGAQDRATALRWIIDADDDKEYYMNDPDYFCSLRGLPYGYMNKDLAEFANS